uniref:UPF3 domain-containing protein n=1 Tax=Falco tinnunculus TaxID=100819 RepID=A0A8C4URB2_FALTI
MRSEREAGPGLMRGGGREKWPMDIPLRRESPRRDPDAPPNPPLAPPPSPPSLLLPPPPPPLQPVPGKQRDEKKTALSKVVIRRLPPCLTKEQLEEQLHPLPAHDYFEFCTADPSFVRLLQVFLKSWIYLQRQCIPGFFFRAGDFKNRSLLCMDRA